LTVQALKGDPRGQEIFFAVAVRQPSVRAHIERQQEGRVQPKRRILPDDADTTAGIARALAALSEIDLLRLKAIARLRARDLPGGVGWSDLLNEAIARALDGTRQSPEGLGMVAFLAGIMRSIASEHWRRLKREAGIFASGDDEAAADPAPDPERSLAAVQALATLDQLFANDPQAARILAGLGAGLAAREILECYGLTEVEYDSARKRMRRLLLRQGIKWSYP
jgi:DNA-directed RNA polymerase specialized sigma24 family protein